jgi:hypothetical protein
LCAERSFDKPVTCPLQSVIIGSRLDTDIHQNTCRLAFSGRLLEVRFCSAAQEGGL